MKNVHPIFVECCAKTPQSMYDSSEPYHEGGYLCGANATMCVRMREIESEEPHDPCKPSIAALSWPGKGVKYDSKPTILPEVSNVELVTCLDCEGTRKVGCIVCSSGLCECYACGCDHECNKCGGTGQSNCDSCNSDGKQPPPQKSVKVTNNYWLDAFVIDMLNRHGAKVFLPTERGPNPAYFTIDGGIEGLAMPMVKLTR